MSENIMGMLRPGLDKCDFCGRAFTHLYYVTNGPCIGKFCSAMCLQDAKKTMNDGVENYKPKETNG